MEDMQLVPLKSREIESEVVFGVRGRRFDRGGQGIGSAVEGTHPIDEGRSGTKITKGRGNLLITEDCRGRRVMHLEERRESLLKAIN